MGPFQVQTVAYNVAPLPLPPPLLWIIPHIPILLCACPPPPSPPKYGPNPDSEEDAIAVVTVAA